MRLKRTFVWITGVFIVSALTCVSIAQTISKFERDRAEEMLKAISNDVTKHYYDPKIHGIDWNARVEGYKQKIATTNSQNMALSIIAAALDSLNDSHTFFLPPPRPYTHDFGWQLQMIGDSCFVTEVRPGSDVESKGIRPGDQVLSINGFSVDPENLRKMNYVFNILRPQARLRVLLLSPNGQQRQVDIVAKIKQLKEVTNVTAEGGGEDIWELIRKEEDEEHFIQPRIAYLGNTLMILKLPAFSAFSNSETWDMLKKSRDYKTLVLDLRGNPGGSVDTLDQIISHLFSSDVKIGNRITRDATKPLIVKCNHREQFTGKLVVLVDSRSASASEIFARVVQIEKRGIVIGDKTAGAVMEAKHYNYKAGADTVVFYGASITEADIVMADGKSLEHVGVTPDEIVLPIPSDLANGSDPVMALAAEIAGVKLDPAEAGKIFPYRWTPE
jgi:carboxyl-terminal processing protease